MRRLLPIVTSLLAASIVAGVGAGAQAPETGTITGRVTLTSRIKGRALPSTAYPTRAVGAHDPIQAGVSIVWARRWW